MSVPVTGARLSLADFVPDSTTGVLLPPGAATPAGYLDGAERALLEGLPAIADRGTGSDELRTLMTDWPTSYHLTPYRATILDCLGFARAGEGRVLELGAGCGAVTRWLGEHFAEVHAVEGSASRAHVIRERCADLDVGARLQRQLLRARRARRVRPRDARRRPRVRPPVPPRAPRPPRGGGRQPRDRA